MADISVYMGHEDIETTRVISTITMKSSRPFLHEQSFITGLLRKACCTHVFQATKNRNPLIYKDLRYFSMKRETGDSKRLSFIVCDSKQSRGKNENLGVRASIFILSGSTSAV